MDSNWCEFVKIRARLVKYTCISLLNWPQAKSYKRDLQMKCPGLFVCLFVFDMVSTTIVTRDKTTAQLFKVALSVSMLCAPTNRRHTKMADFEYFRVLSVKKIIRHKLIKVY